MKQSSGRSENFIKKLELAALKEICFVLDAIYKRGHINGFKQGRLHFAQQELFPATILSRDYGVATINKILSEAKLTDYIFDTNRHLAGEYILTISDWQKFRRYHALITKQIVKLENGDKKKPYLRKRQYADIDSDESIVAEHKPPKPKPLLLYLTNDCDLYKEPQEKFCYSLRNGQMAEKILRAVSEGNNAYRPTKTIQLEVESMSPGSVRKTIQKINARATENLKLEIDDILIQGRPSSGYRINPKYKIKSIKTSLQ